METKMNYFCCVPNCDTNILVHRFPNDLELFNRWIKLVNIPEITFESRDLFRVCDVHFSDNMKFHSHENKIFLRKGAYPDTKILTQEFTVETNSGVNPVDDIYGRPVIERQKSNSNDPLLTNSSETPPDLSQPSTSQEDPSIVVGGNTKKNDKNTEEVLMKLGVIMSGQLQTTRGHLKKARRVFQLKCQLYTEKLNFVKLKKEKFLMEHILKMKLLKKQLEIEQRRLQRSCVRCRRLRQ